MIVQPGNDLTDLYGGDLCLHCGKRGAPPLVHWHGDDGGKAVNLSLHPRCALHFGLRFMRDVHELDLDESLSFGVGEGRSGRLALALWADEYLPSKAAPAAVGVALY